MEKTVENSTMQSLKIILTGPESTGKSALAGMLSDWYKAPCVCEYAREYLVGLDRKYTYADVLHIARKQVEFMQSDKEIANKLTIVDTYLIITKVWMKRVFNTVPDWIDVEIRKTNNDLYLLCQPDIPWIADPLRENGGEMRNVLYAEYEEELKLAGLQYVSISGQGQTRINNAIRAVEDFLANRE
jgi:nicotinamide riboside kinase